MKKILYFCILILVLFTGCESGEKEILIVPRNFHGYILILYNQEAGSPEEYDGSKRVYKIPDNGILRTQFKYNSGWRYPSEYYYEKKLPSNMLQSFLQLEKVPQDTVVGFMGSSGSIRINDQGEERLRFTEHFIGTRPEIEQAKDDVDKLDIVKLIEK
jgi:hypothetical protein